LAQCASAEFACSMALQRDEFLTLVATGSVGALVPGGPRSGVSEFAGVLETLKGRPTPKWGIVNRDLWMRASSGTTPEASLRCLSPSDTSIARALEDISRLVPAVREARIRIPAPTQNHAAVVLWASVGRISVLLGADLEESSIAGTGWQAAVDGSNLRPNERAEVYKVAHHGSASGHNPQVFSVLLVDHPYLVLAPFMRGRNPLPTKQDRERLCGLSDNVFVTSPVRFLRTKQRDRSTEKLITATVENIWAGEAPLGHVRLRKPTNSSQADSWEIVLGGAAIQLCQ
jgi:hypothetical protein